MEVKRDRYMKDIVERKKKKSEGIKWLSRKTIFSHSVKKSMYFYIQ